MIEDIVLLACILLFWCRACLHLKEVPAWAWGFATAWIVTANMLRSPTKLTSRLLTYLYIILQHSAGLEQSHLSLAIASMPPLLLFRQPLPYTTRPLSSAEAGSMFRLYRPRSGRTPTRSTKTLVLPCACLHRVRNAPGGAFA